MHDAPPPPYTRYWAGLGLGFYPGVGRGWEDAEGGGAWSQGRDLEFLAYYPGRGLERGGGVLGNCLGAWSSVVCVELYGRVGLVPRGSAIG